MRVLPLLVWGETLALVVLAGMWFTCGPEPVVGAMPAAPVAPVRDAPVSLVGGVSWAKADGASSADARERSVIAAAAPDGRAEVVVHGRLAAADGGAAPTEAGISFRRGGAQRSGGLIGDRYAVAGLTSGPWRARVVAEGFAVHESDCALVAAPLQNVDFTLQRAVVVKVFLRKPDGTPLAPALRSLRSLRGLRVVVSRAPIADDFGASEASIVGDLDGGRYRGGEDRIGAPPDPEGADGELVLDQPAPLHAALLMRHLVLLRETIAPGQTALTFTLSPEAVKGRLTLVRVRVVDGATGQPVVGAGVLLETSSGGGSRGQTDEAGVVLVEQVLPGLASFMIGAKGYEQVLTLLRVPGSEGLDVGDVVLHPAVKLRGRLVDEAGEPVSGSVSWTDLATMTWPRELISRHTASADGDGEFEVANVGPRRYVVTAMTSEGKCGVGVLEGGRAERTTIRMQPAVWVRVAVTGDPYGRYMATLRDRTGVPVATKAIEARWREARLRVPPGDYVLEVHDGGERLVKTAEIAARGPEIEVEVQ